MQSEKNLKDACTVLEEEATKLENFNNEIVKQHKETKEERFVVQRHTCFLPEFQG